MGDGGLASAVSLFGVSLSVICQPDRFLKFIRLRSVLFKFHDVVVPDMQLTLTNISAMLTFRIMSILITLESKLHLV